jgi:hypothetical protein
MYTRTFYCSHTKFRRQRIVFVACVKKDKPCLVTKAISEHPKLSILQKPHKINFFRETLCATIEYLDVHPNIFWELF